MKSMMIAAAMLLLGVGGAARAQDKPCMADAARLCPNVEPGSGQISCLKEHKAELSPACKKKVMETKVKQQEQQELQKQQKQQQPPPPPPQQ